MMTKDFLAPLQQRRVRLSKLADQVEALRKNQRELRRAVDNHKSFVPELEKEKIRNLDDAASNLSQEISEAQERKSKLAHDLHEVSSEKSNPLIFWKLFTAEQRQVRKEANRLFRNISLIEKRLKEDQEAQSKARLDASVARKRLAENENFNIESSEKKISALGPEIERAQSEHSAASENLNLIEDSIRPHIEEYERLQSALSKLNDEIDAANRFDKKLSAASDKRGRAIIHAECEAKFGLGSPGKVIYDRRGKISSLERNLPKLERRIHDELRKSDRQIGHLLIDGNNACYEGQSFIGLRGISALLAALGDRYKTTVVFDASIRSLLKTDNQGVEQGLGNLVKTHVAPTKTGADEYLLKLAENGKNTYILSNDRFAEYHDFDVVKSNRLIRFLIADGQIMSNDLDVSVKI